MEFTVGLESPFNLDYTLESGQVFRWVNRGEWWYGVVSGGVLKVRQEGDSLKCSSSSDILDGSFVRDYFRLDDDLQEVNASIMKDKVVRQAVQRFYGLRLVRQERWECLASFVLATNSNIPRIRKMVEAVCSRYGPTFEFEGVSYFAFPRPGSLAGARMPDLRRLGLGYRAPYLKKVASSIEDGSVDFTEVSEQSYEEARGTLLKELWGEKVLTGVGPKVADCVLLYSCGKDEAFPIDVWIARAMLEYYPHLLKGSLRRRLRSGPRSKLSFKDYSEISEAARKYFGRYSGYAQQYLFMNSRMTEATA